LANPIPFQLDAYLFFDGQCAEAMQFYERALGGKLESMMKFGEGPPGSCEEGDKDRIMHASLLVEGRRLMASDSVTRMPVGKPSGFAVALHYPTTDGARRAFDALAEGGTINMPLGKTFWAEAFGMVVDRFGVMWMIGGGAEMA
jgi:PhnB protein